MLHQHIPGHSPAASLSLPMEKRVRLVLVSACYLVLWHLCHFYRGLDHDAQLYALQAISRLRPDLYANDIFFRFGSQDNYTIFTVAYSALAGHIGLDGAASTLTFALIVLSYVAMGLVARALIGTQAALLSVGLLVVTDLNYGGYRIFKTTEEFLTARLAAEAVALLALAVWLRRRRLVAALLLVVALLLHPLMAMPAVVTVALLAIPERMHPRIIAMGAVTLLMCSMVAMLTPIAGLRIIDAEWLNIINTRSYYLFPGKWLGEDWSRLAVILTTLMLGSVTVNDPKVVSLCKAALIAAVAGVCLSAFSELVPIQILIQGQPWRWSWLPAIVSLVLMPALLRALWTSGQVGRVSATLLATGWLMFDTSGGFLAAAALVIWLSRSALPSVALRWLLVLAVGAVAIVLVWTAGTIFTILSWRFVFGGEPILVERARNVLDILVPAVALAFALWHVAYRVRIQVAAPLLLVFLAATVPAMAKSSVDRWLTRVVDESTRKSFSDWREIIPANAEVLWLWTPIPTWFVLERQSFMSRSQGAGLVFSRALAMEIERRAKGLNALGETDWLIVGGRQSSEPPEFSAGTLRSVCAESQLSFVVHSVRIEPNVGSHEWPRKGERVWLYDCSDYRQEPLLSSSP